MNRLFGSESAPAAFIPPADVLVSDDGVSVYMDVPGVGRDRLEIDLENEVLTIRGERPYPYPTDDPERRAASGASAGSAASSAASASPAAWTPDTIDASLHDGVLTLRIPRPVTQQPHRIEIKDGSDVAEASDSPEFATAGSKT